MSRDSARHKPVSRRDSARAYIWDNSITKRSRLWRGGSRRFGSRVVSPAWLSCSGSAEGHLGDEEVVAARAEHVRVENHDLAVGTRLGEGVGIIVGVR